VSGARPAARWEAAWRPRGADRLTDRAVAPFGSGSRSPSSVFHSREGNRGGRRPPRPGCRGHRQSVEPERHPVVAPSSPKACQERSSGAAALARSASLPVVGASRSAAPSSRPPGPCPSKGSSSGRHQHVVASVRSFDHAHRPSTPCASSTGKALRPWPLSRFIGAGSGGFSEQQRSGDHARRVGPYRLRRRKPPVVRFREPG